MLWTELELERVVPDDDLRGAWGHVFQVGADAVAVVDDVADAAPWPDPQTRILLERRLQAGEFPLHLMVILRSPRLAADVADPARERTLLTRLCIALDCRMLTGDDTLAPQRWTLIAPDGTFTPVELDAEQLDDDALVLARRPVVAG